jgi:hypothetical protein
MKAITTIFESILGQDDSLVWTPADGPTNAIASRGWDWTGVEAQRGWTWTG